MARRGSQPPSPSLSPAISIDVSRSLQATQSKVNTLHTQVAKQKGLLDGKLSKSETDLLSISSFVNTQLQSTGAHPLSISSLQGQAAQPQLARVPNYDTLPGSAPPGVLVQKNGQIYTFGPSGAGGVLGMWNGLGGAGCLMDTHANRIANYPATSYQPGTLFYETDRTVLYVDKAGVWNFAAGTYEDVLANQPIDLTAPDESFLFFATDTSALYIWNGATLAWVVIGGGSSMLSERTVTASTAVTGLDYTIFADATSAALTVTFPPATPESGRILNVKKIDSVSAHAVTLDGNGSDIEGAATLVMSLPQLSIETQFDGTQWRII